jgi:Asp/Glu/hydantoin racemase
MARILVLVPFPLDVEDLARRREQLGEVEISPGVSYEFRSVKVGPTHFDSDHDSLLADLGLIEAGLRAEEEGYDAVCVDTVSDSGVNVLRSLLSIPVVGPGRASFLTALMLGDRFSIVTMWEPWALGYRKTLHEMDLESKCVSIRWPEGVTPDVSTLLAGKEQEVFPKILAAAEACVADGAHTICLGSTTMHQVHAYLRERLLVPVINPGPLSYKVVEMLLSLGLRHSVAAYARPRSPKREVLEAMLAAGAEFEGR